MIDAISSGLESRVYRYDTPDGPLILRLNPSAEGFYKDEFAYQRFRSAKLPVPRVLGIGQSGDDYFCISECVPGVTLQDLGPIALEPVVGPVTEALEAIAAADITGLTGFGPFDAAGHGQCVTWRDYLEEPLRYPWTDYPAPADLLNCLSRLLPGCPEVRALVHGDFGSNNVLTDGAAVTGVIDWSEAAIGDPLYDVANILFWRPWLPCMELQACYFESHRPDLLRDSERLLAYQLRIGLAEIQSGSEWAAARCRELIHHL
jgi:hygromycin-B 4-O-kinase